MSATNVGVGDTVKIDVLIPDGGSGLYPQATLLDAANTPLGVSPLDLSYVSGDLYSATFVMPSTDKVTATTIVYSDSGHTTPDTNYEPTIDEFIKASAVDNAAIADAVWDEALSGHVSVGTMGANQNLIDDLETESSAASRASTNQSEHDQTQADIAALSFPTPPTAGDIADAVWDESLAGHLSAGSTGEALNDAGAVSDPSAIADAVWDEAKSGHVAAGSFGAEIGTSQAEHDATQAAIAALNDLSQADVQTAMDAQGYTSVRAALLDNLDDQISNVISAINALEISIKGADDLDLTDLGGAGFMTALHSLVALRAEIDGIVLNIQNLGIPELVGIIDDTDSLEGTIINDDTLEGVLEDC